MNGVTLLTRRPASEEELAINGSRLAGRQREFSYYTAFPVFFRFFSACSRADIKKSSRPLKRMGLVVEFLIEPAGRSRRGVGQRNVAAAVALTGCVYVRSIDHPTDHGREDRTVIVTFEPSLLSEAAIISTGNKLASLRPDRVVLVAEGQNAQCLVFSDSLLALRTINALVSGDGARLTVQSLDARGRVV